MKRTQQRCVRLWCGTRVGVVGAAAFVLVFFARVAAAKTNSVYVTNNGSAYDDNEAPACTVSEYNINAKSGALAAVSGSPIQAPMDSEPEGIAVTPSGKFAYVVASESQQIVEYRRSTGGQLKQLA